MRVVGVDGFKDRWIAIVLEDGFFALATVRSTLAEVLELAPDAAAIGVDVPIGSERDAFRRTDVEARAFIGARRNAVFPMPPIDVFRCPDYARACKLCRELTGAAPSKQAFELRFKILEAAEVAASNRRVIEVHPEVSFRQLVGRELPGKKTWTGHVTRRAALAKAAIVIPDDLGEAGVAGVDDVLDAGAAAWSAHRYSQRSARRIGPEIADATGRPIAIWY